MSASLIVVGISHKTAPVSLLERFSVPEDELLKALDQLTACPHVVEGAILSTCNRTEVYAVVSKFHAGVQDVRTFVSEFFHAAPEDFAHHLYDFHDDAAARHLLFVATGLESLVVGESEILGQVRRAGQQASDAGVAGTTLRALFGAAVRAGKRARAETAIGRQAASVSTAAVALARDAFGSAGLRGRRVLLVGAGEMGRQAARLLTDAGADLVLTNRTPERGRPVAAELGAGYRDFAEVEGELGRADVVICSTSSPGFVLDASALRRAARERGASGPILVIDIAVPRDVDLAAREVPGIVLRDLDDLRATVRSGLISRERERPRVQRIVDEELERLSRQSHAADQRAIAAEIVREVDCERLKELERLEAVLPNLDPAARHEIDRMTKRLIARSVHGPLNKARLLGAPDPGASYMAMLAELYGIAMPSAGSSDSEEDA